MEDLRATLYELNREFCDLVYEHLRGDYPDFIVFHWYYRLEDAKAGLPDAETAQYVLETEAGLKLALQTIVDFYDLANVSIEAATDEGLLLAAQDLIVGASTLVLSLCGSECYELLGEINDMSMALQQRIAEESEKES